MFNISKIQIESNSQRGGGEAISPACCVQYFKDTNRKQFTTGAVDTDYAMTLCSIFQRYKSKAIHNLRGRCNQLFCVVFNISKIQIESNSQLKSPCSVTSFSCVQYFKDTNRKQFTTMRTAITFMTALCSIFQRYKSKAIHNNEDSDYVYDCVVFNISKIQIESNSQL